MTENEIFQIMFAGLQTQGLFLIGFAFLTWFAGRCAVVANESGNANIVSKIVTSAFALSSLWYLNINSKYFFSGIEGIGSLGISAQVKIVE